MTTILADGLSVIDTTSTAQICAFEQAFYLAFSRVPENRLIRTLWRWNDAEGRLATAIPYEDQRIYVACREGRIITGLALNVALRSWQSAAYGFPHPGTDAPVCEVLANFVTEPISRRERRVLWQMVKDDQRARGIVTAYATSAPAVMPLYKTLGADILDETEIDGQIRYYYRLPL